MRLARLACPCGCHDEKPADGLGAVACWGCGRQMSVFGEREGWYAAPVSAPDPAAPLPPPPVAAPPPFDAPSPAVVAPALAPAPPPPPIWTAAAVAAARAWLEPTIERWGAQAAHYAHAGYGRRAYRNAGGALEEVVARLRTQLAALPDIEEPAPIAAAAAAPPAPATPLATAWADPVFHVGGRFNPSAGTLAQRMLASAATCRKLGCEEAAIGFEKRAAEAETRASGVVLEFAAPPTPEPFDVGPQIELFAA